jgi:hypothetical protein
MGIILDPEGGKTSEGHHRSGNGFVKKMEAEYSQFLADFLLAGTGFFGVG